VIVDPRAEIEATKSLLALQEAAERCREAYGRANMALPEPLKRFFGLSDRPSPEKTKRTVIPELDLPRPTNSMPDWLPVPLDSATPTSVALAILRSNGGGPLRAGLVTEKVLDLLPNSTKGSVANAGTKMDEEGLIERTDEGWKLKNLDAAPTIFEGYVWGPVATFTRQEVAAYRRLVVLHLLRLAQAGLQTSQIIEQLKQCAWMLAPANKEIVQADIETLQSEKKIRRRGASKKWELMPEKGGS
jgi:hypothetical protein